MAAVVVANPLEDYSSQTQAAAWPPAFFIFMNPAAAESLTGAFVPVKFSDFAPANSFGKSLDAAGRKIFNRLRKEIPFMKNTQTSVKLDPSRLLGFRLGANDTKSAGKLGSRLGSKAGSKAGGKKPPVVAVN